MGYSRLRIWNVPAAEHPPLRAFQNKLDEAIGSSCRPRTFRNQSNPTHHIDMISGLVSRAPFDAYSRSAIYLEERCVLSRCQAVGSKSRGGSSHVGVFRVRLRLVSSPTIVSWCGRRFGVGGSPRRCSRFGGKLFKQWQCVCGVPQIRNIEPLVNLIRTRATM